MDALGIAVVRRNLGLVRMLLERGADPNSRSLDGKSVMRRTVEQSTSGVLAALIERGAKDLASRTSTLTGLKYACHMGYAEPALMIVDSRCGDPADCECGDKTAV